MTPNGPIRFGAFEVDLAARELRKSGVRIRLQEQPFRVLAMLLARPGEVVTREELQQELWPNEEYGEFDLGLNTAVKKLRQALNDSADSPRWIETVPKVGYKFVAPIGRGVQEAPEAKVPRKVWVGASAAVVLAAFAGGAVAWRFLGVESERQAPSRRFAYTEAKLFAGVPDLQTPSPKIAPDGSAIAYSAGRDRQVWLRRFDEQEARPILDEQGANFPFWSPDSRWLAYSERPGNWFGALRAISTQGEPPRTICQSCEVHSWLWPFGDWSPDGEWIVYVNLKSLHRVRAEGGEPEEIHRIEGRGIIVHPVFLDDDRIAITWVRSFKDQEMLVLDVSSGRTKSLGPGFALDNSPTRHLIYKTGYQQSGLWAMPLTADGERDGDPFQIHPDADMASVSNEGTLVYAESPKALQQLAWVDREGKILSKFGRPQKVIAFFRLSPDERFVAGVDNADTGDIWIHETSRQVAHPLPFTSKAAQLGWSPDGRKIVYASELDDLLRFRIHESEAKAEAEPRVITPAARRDGLPEGYTEWSPSYSPDGRTVLYQTRGLETRRDLRYLTGTAGGAYEDNVLLATDWDEAAPIFSPDGRYVAYRSDRTGGNEIEVLDFPEGRRARQVSVGGGLAPRRWRGSELFYLKDGMLMAVPIEREPKLSPGSPVELFPLPIRRASSFDVSKDGQRFVVTVDVGEDPNRPPTIHVWQNWYAAFRDQDDSE